MEKLGIYVHIPFCKSKCNYCDFVSFSGKEFLEEEYIKALIDEIKYKNFSFLDDQNYKENEFKERKITTIYIGGGTPSYIKPESIKLIIDLIKTKFDVSYDAEITIEINPGTVTKEKLIDYKEAGINRISIGLQSTNERILKFIGRIHTYDEFLTTYQTAREVGFSNINVDLILAIPTQTMDELVKSTIDIINLKPNHISIYSMILEENTPLTKMVAKGIVDEIPEKLERKMYWKVKRMLEKNKYKHYEISNFAQKGFESKHNLDCWNQEEYIGYGLAAHSYFNNVRFSNIDNLEEYIDNIKSKKIEKNIQIEEKQTKEMKMKEYMMLGFRKIDGISISEFERKFEINPLFYFRFELEKLVEEELIDIDLDNIFLTKKGIDFANFVFEEFV